jgi:phi13 family phage major tail protein
MSENVRYGLSNVYYALATADTSGKLTWAVPVAIPTAQEFSMSRAINTQNVYADNKLIFSVQAETNATLTMKFSVIPDDVKEAILNHKTDSKGHDVEITNADTKFFALILQIQGDSKARRRVYPKCTAVLGDEQTSTTNENITVNSDTLTITAYPVDDSGTNVLFYDVDSSDTDYATVVTAAPTLPTFTA